MKVINRLILVLLAGAALYFVACKKTSDTKFVSYNNYAALRLGKYIIYQLDSTVTASFGSYFVKRSYLIKDSIVQIIKDNQNRETFKIYRYQYDSTYGVWNSTNTFYLTPAQNSLEYVENNLRYISLVNAVADNKSWLGNSYISQTLYNPNSFFNSWQYSYKDVAQPKKIGKLNFANTITVQQYDSLDANNLPFSPNNYSAFTKAYEIYADSVGLVYKDIFSWQYENAVYSGYGIKQTIVSHN